MSKSKVNQRRSLENSVNLKSFAADKDLLKVVIETPKGVATSLPSMLTSVFLN
jgi:hypothetical protein